MADLNLFALFGARVGAFELGMMATGVAVAALPFVISSFLGGGGPHHGQVIQRAFSLVRGVKPAATIAAAVSEATVELLESVRPSSSEVITLIDPSPTYTALSTSTNITARFVAAVKFRRFSGIMDVLETSFWRQELTIPFWAVALGLIVIVVLAALVILGFSRPAVREAAPTAVPVSSAPSQGTRLIAIVVGLVKYLDFRIERAFSRTTTKTDVLLAEMHRRFDSMSAFLGPMSDNIDHLKGLSIITLATSSTAAATARQLEKATNSLVEDLAALISQSGIHSAKVVDLLETLGVDVQKLKATVDDAAQAAAEQRRLNVCSLQGTMTMKSVEFAHQLRTLETLVNSGAVTSGQLMQEMRQASLLLNLTGIDPDHQTQNISQTPSAPTNLRQETPQADRLSPSTAQAAVDDDESEFDYLSTAGIIQRPEPVIKSSSSSDLRKILKEAGRGTGDSQWARKEDK